MYEEGGGGGGHESSERWLISYADFITLMFAVFVVLYSVSMNAEREKAYKSITKAVGAPAPQGAASNLEQAQAQIEEIKQRIESKLSQVPNPGITVSIDTRGLVISLSAVRFFASGDATIAAEQSPVLDLVVQIIKSLSNQMRIEGFTDSIPIRNERFADNWDLSTARAGTVLRYIVDHSEIAPDHLSLAGYGPYRPIAPEDTEDARSLNRRVDIVIPPLFVPDCGQHAAEAQHAG
jgi:chemotaxis protein MotB